MSLEHFSYHFIFAKKLFWKKEKWTRIWSTASKISNRKTTLSETAGKDAAQSRLPSAKNTWIWCAKAPVLPVSQNFTKSVTKRSSPVRRFTTGGRKLNSKKFENTRCVKTSCFSTRNRRFIRPGSWSSRSIWRQHHQCTRISWFKRHQCRSRKNRMSNFRTRIFRFRKEWRRCQICRGRSNQSDSCSIATDKTSSRNGATRCQTIRDAKRSQKFWNQQRECALLRLLKAKKHLHQHPSQLQLQAMTVWIQATLALNFSTFCLRKTRDENLSGPARPGPDRAGV